MDVLGKKAKPFYFFSILFTTILCLFISVSLSIFFWLSFSNTIYLAVLFIAFALVFELAKIYAFLEGTIQTSLSKRIPLWGLYVFLSLISVIGSAGGLNSLLTKNQSEEILSSSQYQSLKQHI
jgi:hypothetical protein